MKRYYKRRCLTHRRLSQHHTPQIGHISSPLNIQKHFTHFHHYLIVLDAMDTARERVFATEELFEGILSFLPFKKLFYIRRVSKRWAEGIDGSVTLQQKMFLQPRDQPELWIVDRKHKLGANNYRKKYEHLNDTELKFKRVKVSEDDSRPITPVTLNPLLKDDNNTVISRSNIFRMAIGCDFEEATNCGSTDAFRDQGNSSVANASF